MRSDESQYNTSTNLIRLRMNRIHCRKSRIISFFFHFIFVFDRNVKVVGPRAFNLLIFPGQAEVEVIEFNVLDDFNLRAKRDVCLY